jgi:hypothetical protein
VLLAPSVSATLPDKLFSELGSNTNWNERKTSGKLSVIVLWSWLKYCHWLAICYVCTGGGSDKRLGASYLLCFMQLGRGRYVKTQLSLCPIYYADDDVFRPLWATFRSHRSIMRKIILCVIISRVLILNIQEYLVIWFIHIELILSPISKVQRVQRVCK